MPRLKQVKPQHINLEKDRGEQQPQQQAPEFTDVAPAAPVAGELGTPVNYVETGDEMNRDQVMVKRPRLEETHICEKCCGEFFSFSEFSEHKKNCTEHRPIFIMNDNEQLVPLEDFPGAVLSHQPQSSSSKDSHGEDGGTSGDMKEKPGMKSVLYLKKETTLPSTPQDLSYLPRGKVTNTNVILQALEGTKVAVSQRSADALPASPPSANSIPPVLDQIFCLQQQQLQQIQLTEQIRVQMDMWATNTLHAGMVGAGNLNTLGNQVSQPVSAAMASLSQNAGSQGLPLDTSKQARLPHTNILCTTSPVSPGLMSSALRLDGPRVFPSHIPCTLLPGPPSSVLFQSPFSTAPLDLSKKGKEKPPNMFPVDVKSQNLVSFSRHVCKYCGRVFETDSSLQIHLCSHTGKRLFACSICGHWFTTEGKLKEHFYEHLQMKANAQLFAQFHNQMVTGSGARCVRSAPVPVGECSLSLDSRSVLVPGTPSVGLPWNLSLASNPRDLKSGPLAKDLHHRRPPEIEDRSIYSGVGPDYNSPRVGGFQGRGRPEPGQTLMLQQLVKNVDKATTNPNECHICHRALSCQSALRMHYRTHTGERPFQCMICNRSFSTKGSLKSHLGVHQTNTSVKTQYSCPICQKKFTNAVMLQQHIRMHTGGQIPDTPLPENPCVFAGPELMVVSESGSTSTVCHNDIECIDVDEISSQDAPSSSSKVPVPPPSIHLTSPTLGFTMMTPFGAPRKVSPAPVVLQRQSSRGKGSVKSGGLTSDSSSVIGDPQYQNRSPDVLETTSFQDRQAENIKFKSPDAGGKTERLENSLTEMGGWSSLPFDRAQPACVKVEVSGAFGSSTMSPGMTPLLMAQPGQQGKQYGYMWYGENQSSASALQIREQTHTGKKPFMCNICGQAFTTKGKLQVHYMTHVANNSSALCGRKLSVENTADLLGTDGKKLPEMFPQEIMAPSVGMSPVMGNPYTIMPNDDLAMKTNKIPVIKTVGTSTSPASLEVSSLVDNTTVSKTDSQRSQTPVPSLTGGKQDSGQLS